MILLLYNHLVTNRERVRCLTRRGKEGLNVSDCRSYLKRHNRYG